MADEMAIMARTFELLDWLLPRAETFPRSYRHTLTRRIVNRALDLNEQLIAAESARGAARGLALQHADDCLQVLRVYLRLIHRWRWINDGQYRHVSRMVAEIGRLLGGWRKRTAPQK